MSAEEEKSKVAEEMESDIEEREEQSRESETALQREVNQDVQTGTSDAEHPGIRWGSSYKTKRKARSGRAKPNSGPKSKP